jgi:hypothetical protein
METLLPNSNRLLMAADKPYHKVLLGNLLFKENTVELSLNSADKFRLNKACSLSKKKNPS